MRKDV